MDEENGLFDPENKTQVKLALRLAGPPPPQLCGLLLFEAHALSTLRTVPIRKLGWDPLR